MSEFTDTINQLSVIVAKIEVKFGSMSNDWNEAIYKMEDARAELEAIYEKATIASEVFSSLRELVDMADAVDTIANQDVPSCLYIDEI